MKKVLIFSHNPFSDIYNNGKTLKNIFSLFDKSQLSQIYIDSNQEPDLSVCSNYFHLSDRDVIRSYYNKKKPIGTVLNIENNYLEKPIRRRKNLKLPKKNNLTMLLRNIIWNYSKWHSAELKKWIEQQAPDVIFFVGGGYTFSNYLALELSNYYNLPLITYYTDDYIINFNKNNFISKFYYKKLIIAYNKIISKSAYLFTIGEMMSNEYTVFFGKKFDYIMNCVDVEPYSHTIQSDIITISYFGGLHLKRWKALIEFAEELKSLDLKLDYQINIYTATKLDENIIKEFNNYSIVVKKPLKGTNLKDAIYNSQFLLHLESNDANMIRLTKYSVSTKIPEYLMASRMIIGYGPNEVASMKLISDNKVGIVLDKRNNNYNSCLLQLKKYIENVKLTEEVTKVGYKFALDNFSKEKVSKKLYDIINKI